MKHHKRPQYQMSDQWTHRQLNSIWNGRHFSSTCKHAEHELKTETEAALEDFLHRAYRAHEWILNLLCDSPLHSGFQKPRNLQKVRQQRHLLSSIPDENIALTTRRNPLRRPSGYGRNLIVYLFFVAISHCNRATEKPRHRPESSSTRKYTLLLKNISEVRKCLRFCSDAERKISTASLTWSLCHSVLPLLASQNL